MYPITSAVKALFDTEQRQVLRVTGRDRNGRAISLTDADILLNGFSIDRYACNGSVIEIGTAVAAEMTLKLDNRTGKFDRIVFDGTELFVEIGIADWSQASPTVNWIPCGYFTPDIQPRRLGMIELSALDRMTRFDEPVQFGEAGPWVDENGNEITDENGNVIYFYPPVSDFPCTVESLVEQVCDICGVPLATSIASLTNAQYMVSGIPDLQQTVNYRNLIQWAAGIMGTNAYVDWNGELRFAWFDTQTGYTTTLANRFASDLHEDDITVTGVTYTSLQGISMISGDPDYALDLTGNYLIGTDYATVVSNVNTAVNGFTYRPFSADVINAPYLWPMDNITFTDKNNVDHSCALMNVHFGINGITVLESKGQYDAYNGGSSNNQAFLIEKTAQSVKDLDDSMTQEEIFNRLTDGGETQGLYLYNGKIYINASYIQTGEFVADLIKSGKIQSQNGYLTFDLDNSVLDAIASSGLWRARLDSASLDFGYRSSTSGNFANIGYLKGVQIGNGLPRLEMYAPYFINLLVSDDAMLSLSQLTGQLGMLDSNGNIESGIGFAKGGPVSVMGGLTVDTGASGTINTENGSATVANGIVTALTDGNALTKHFSIGTGGGTLNLEVPGGARSLIVICGGNILTHSMAIMSCDASTGTVNLTWIVQGSRITVTTSSHAPDGGLDITSTSACQVLEFSLNDKHMTEY